MMDLLLVFTLGCGLCLALTPLARAVARRCGLLDRPDGWRKVHARAVPAAGGFAILLAASATLAAALLVPNPLSEPLLREQEGLLALLAAAGVICLVGVLDDYGWLRGRHKLLGQLIAVAIVMSSGLIVRHLRLFRLDLELGLLAVPFTAFLLLGAINSLNLLDGMDGLLSTVGFIICLALGTMAAMGQHWAAACVAVALAGALVGFLRYNLPPATIFLGDSGSMLIGLVVGTLAIRSSLKGPATITLAAPLAVLTIPILDTAVAILRRKLTGRSIYTTDRGHLHHCLQRSGLSSLGVVLCISLFCLLTVVGALASLAFNNELIAIVAALVVVGILLVSRLFGYTEFLLLKQRLGAFAVSLVPSNTDGKAYDTELRLQGTAGWNELWKRLTTCAARLRLKSMRLDVNAPALHEGYHARWGRFEDTGEDARLWRTEIPLTAFEQTVGRLEITGERNHASVARQLAAVAMLVEHFDVTAFSSAEADLIPGGNGLPARIEEIKETPATNVSV